MTEPRPTTNGASSGPAVAAPSGAPGGPRATRRLDPDEIEHHEFLVSLRGYDRDEVHDFLATVAAAYRDLLAEVRAPAAAAGATARPDPFVDVADEIAALLRTAQQAAEAIVARAKSQADDLRRAAERDRRAVLESASNLSANVRGHLAALVHDVEQEVTRRVRELDSTFTPLVEDSHSEPVVDLRDDEPRPSTRQPAVAPGS